MSWREAGHRTDDAICESDLKICDLCGALNLARNSECFVCGWHGRFETRTDIVQIAMELLRRKYGELRADLLSDSLTSRQAGGTSIRARLMRAFSRMRNWAFG